jgi:hypothetical protein
LKVRLKEIATSTSFCSDTLEPLVSFLGLGILYV